MDDHRRLSGAFGLLNDDHRRLGGAFGRLSADSPDLASIQFDEGGKTSTFKSHEGAKSISVGGGVSVDGTGEVPADGDRLSYRLSYGASYGESRNKNRMTSDQKTMQQELIEAIEKVEKDPENEPLPECLIYGNSMWRAHEAKCRLFPGIFDPKLIRDDKHYVELMQHQKLAICKAIGYMRFPNARNWEISRPKIDDEEDFKADEVPAWASTPEADRSIRPEGFSPSSQCMLMPPGAGKTAVLIHLAILASRNCLIITNSRDNAFQVVNSIIEHTTINLSFPVRLIRSNEDEHKDKEFVITQQPAAEETHILKNGGVYGIAVIDVHTFHHLTGATAERHGLRLLIFASKWDLVIIDEADSVAAEHMRQAFIHGTVGDKLASDHDTTTSAKLRYKLNYSKLVAMSGTWYRNDVAGARFLASLGPTTYEMKSCELEALGLLAKMKVVLVQCADKNEKVKELEKKYEFFQLTAEKLRVCERLVRLHVAHGQKIMIFTSNYWHVRHLERLFPFALAPTGKTPDKEVAEMVKLFKSDVCQNHPLLWITTMKGEVGMDIPDCSVVINMVNSGSSPKSLRQRMGRASRKKYEKGWFYDIVDRNEKDCMYTLDRLFDAKRYMLLLWDGYGDCDSLVRICSEDLIQRVDDHVDWMYSNTEIEDQMKDVAKAAKYLNDNLVYNSNSNLAVIDTVISCILGSFYKTDNVKKENDKGEDKKCSQTLFDTQSQLRLKPKNGKSAQKRQIQQRKTICKALKEKVKIRKVVVDDVTEKGPVLLTREQYAAFPMPTAMTKKGVCDAIKKALDDLHYDGGSGSNASTTADNPAELWSTIMDIRCKVNKLQFETDKQRKTACVDVLQMGDMTQEHCSFLHAKPAEE